MQNRPRGPVVPADAPVVIERAIAPFRLEAGAALLRPRARTWFWGTRDEQDRLERGESLEPHTHRSQRREPRRTVCLLHTLTGALDPRESFPELFGRTRPFRPWAQRIVAIGLLGSPRSERSVLRIVSSAGRRSTLPPSS